MSVADIFAKAELIDMEKIDIKQSPMVRACDHDPTIKEMWNLLIDGAKYPAIDVFWIEDIASYVVADGRHRYYAHLMNNEEQILANVHKGGQRKALEFALSANSKHGLPLSDADVKCSLRIILDDKEWSRLSNGLIGKMIGRSEATVRRFRKSMDPDISETSGNKGPALNLVSDEVDDEVPKTDPAATKSARKKTVQEPTKRVGADGKERSLPKTPVAKPAGGKEAIKPEVRKEAKAAFGAFVRAVNKVPAWKALLEERLASIAEDMKANWGRGGK